MTLSKVGLLWGVLLRCPGVQFYGLDPTELPQRCMQFMLSISLELDLTTRSPSNSYILSGKTFFIIFIWIRMCSISDFKIFQWLIQNPKVSPFLTPHFVAAPVESIPLQVVQWDIAPGIMPRFGCTNMYKTAPPFYGQHFLVFTALLGGEICEYTRSEMEMEIVVRENL